MASQGDIDRAARWNHALYRVRQKSLKFFVGRDVCSEEIHCLDKQINGQLAITTKNEINLRNWTPKPTISSLILTTGELPSRLSVFKSVFVVVICNTVLT